MLEQREVNSQEVRSEEESLTAYLESELPRSGPDTMMPGVTSPRKTTDENTNKLLDVFKRTEFRKESIIGT